jgi:hypothetical protein
MGFFSSIAKGAISKPGIMAGSTIAGGVAGYNSSDVGSSKIEGAAAGAMGGLAGSSFLFAGGLGATAKGVAKGLGHVSGISQMMNAASGERMNAFRSGTLAKTFTGANSTGRMMGSALKFTAKHPVAVGGAGVMAGAGAWAYSKDSENIDTRAFSDEGRERTQLSSRAVTNSNFQNSASGLVFGLHNRRHN